MSLVRITSLGSFKSIWPASALLLVFLSTLSPSVYGQSKAFEISIGKGDKVKIISDKGYRRSTLRQFEAIGNVIITHKGQALYGEKATLDLFSNTLNIQGNVRYVSSGLTMYGPELEYNLGDGTVTVVNSRLLTANYVLNGKKLVKYASGLVIGEDAEYTTCKDCPESWSLFGKKVRLTLGRYLRVTHAFIKAKGIVLMYLPYMFFPVKKNRETGLLFPELAFRGRDGFRYKQPFFWDIDSDKDITLSPFYSSRRGVGSDFEMRYAYGTRSFAETIGLVSRDSLYEFNRDPLDISEVDNPEVRYQAGLDWAHAWSNKTRHFLHSSWGSDHDLGRDYGRIEGQVSQGLDQGGHFVFETNQSMGSFILEGGYKRNLLTPDPSEFDNSFVQVLPSFKFTSVPLVLWSDFSFPIKGLDFDLDLELTRFRQVQNEDQYTPFVSWANRSSSFFKAFRNADRLSIRPSVRLNYGNIGPVNLKTSLLGDAQRYQFDKINDGERRYFQKYFISAQSEMSFEVHKIYGLAAYKSLTEEETLLKEKMTKTVKRVVVRKEDEDDLIGVAPSPPKAASSKKEAIFTPSYRHNQQFRFIHHLSTESRTRGNDRFFTQLRRRSLVFDRDDIFRELQFNSFDLESQKSIPLSNTLEVQWNNSLIRKRPSAFDPYADNRYLLNNFSYGRLAYLNFGQGYYFDYEPVDQDENGFMDHLTRTAIVGGFSLNRVNFSFSEYYFIKNKTHLFSGNISQSYSIFRYSLGYRYESFSSDVRPSNRSYFATLFISPGPFQFSGRFEYDITQRIYTARQFSILYTPKNHCWRLSFGMRREHINRRVYETQYLFDLLLNFDGENFLSLTDTSQGFSGDRNGAF